MSMHTSSSKKAAVHPKPLPSFYQRPLPKSCVAFASREGKEIFASALNHHGLKSFFPLIQQFTTQTEPAFCGLSTLVLVLNALAVDPLQNWKGPWRWYEESMLNCCLDLDDVKQSGITLVDFQCLAHCQGLSVHLTYCDDPLASLDNFRAAVQTACVESNDDDHQLQVLVVSYSRKVLGQTGSGHFSPIAAYDAVSDRVLILDTARFKYGAHWVELPLVYEAMKPVDPDTGKSRGYALLSFHPHQDDQQEEESTVLQPLSLLFRSKLTQHPARRKYKEFLKSHSSDDIQWQSVNSYWSSSSNSQSVWNILEPVRLPEQEEIKETVLRLRSFLKELMQTVDTESPPTGACCKKSKDHKTNSRCMSDREALYVVYLASLSEERRRDLVLQFQSEASLLTREQLLTEADIVATAIECSDQSSY